MKKREQKQKLIRLLAIVLVVLLVSLTVLTVLVSAFAEEAAPTRDAYDIDIDYLEDEQALHITQRLVYHNRTSFDMDRVVFAAAANMYRRESALIYENDVLEAVFPEG